MTGDTPQCMILLSLQSTLLTLLGVLSLTCPVFLSLSDIRTLADFPDSLRAARVNAITNGFGNLTKKHTYCLVVPISGQVVRNRSSLCTTYSAPQCTHYAPCTPTLTNKQFIHCVHMYLSAYSFITCKTCPRSSAQTNNKTTLTTFINPILKTTAARRRPVPSI